MAKIKQILFALKESVSQFIRAVIERDEANDIVSSSTQHNRYYT
jgi:hypothetical protein